MGNLPRSRPGRRSEKRTGAGGASRKGAAAGGASASRGGGAKRTGGAATSPRSRTARSASKSARPPSGGDRGSRAPDPLGDAVRVAAKVAGTGIGIATGILRRLPRP
jgi:hypothetical protein